MKKQLLKYATLILGAMLPTTLYAQLNPKQGYVITNQNDTIYGTIDYLSDTKCANECRFKPDGEAAYKVYKPGDISAYRFADNGVFYITKTFAVEGQEKTFFAEYLLQGGVSLFQHREGGCVYYFFIDENGKVATAKNDGSDQKVAFEKENDRVRAKNKREALGEVTQIFSKSDKALHDLWVREINAKNLTQITHDYDMEYCTSSGDCVVFRRNEKASRGVEVRARFQFGIGQGTNALSGQPLESPITCNDHTMKTTVAQLGIGADFLFPRSNKHWSVEVMALISKWSMSDEYVAIDSYNIRRDISLKYWDLGFQAGPAYSFKPQSKISPVVRAGFAADIPLSIEKSNFDYLMFDNELNPAIQCYGFYVGAGVDIAIKKHALRLMAEYQWTHSPNKEVDITYLAIKAGIRL